MARSACSCHSRYVSVCRRESLPRRDPRASTLTARQPSARARQERDAPWLSSFAASLTKPMSFDAGASGGLGGGGAPWDAARPGLAPDVVMRTSSSDSLLFDDGESAPRPSIEPPRRLTLHDFEPLALIGRGAFGEVRRRTRNTRPRAKTRREGEGARRARATSTTFAALTTTRGFLSLSLSLARGTRRNR